ncbi:MAG TPA: radical SAM protein [Vicinamibacterales bacterium]|nr:radical SAM protein [Vicinamibacterales bacterium]
MENEPLLFDLGPPTTRRVADLVKEGGVAALTEAERRADAATYQEVRCRSALNHVPGMRYFEWTLNPYRGCTHGCHYCYARRYHAQFELGAGDEFASVILVKTNFVEVLRRELAKPSWTREMIGLGTATDIYQPIEGHYKLTRRTLEALVEARTPTGVITKGPMIVRDKDLLARLSAVEGSSVVVSVPCSDAAVTARLEPGTAPPRQRLRAVRELLDAGVNAGVLMSPIVPGISSKPSLIEKTIKDAAAAGVPIVGSNVMHLQGGTREHFTAWLAREFPHLVAGYSELYKRDYAPASYCNEVKRVVAGLRTKHGPSFRDIRTARPARSMPEAYIAPDSNV